jgi:hypothetical protein
MDEPSALEVNEKLVDYFFIKTITFASVESMYNGAVTSYQCIVGLTLIEVLKQDVGLLSEELSDGVFAQKFNFQAKLASRTWKKFYTQVNLLEDEKVEGASTEITLLLASFAGGHGARVWILSLIQWRNLPRPIMQLHERSEEEGLHRFVVKCIEKWIGGTAHQNP